MLRNLVLGSLVAGFCAAMVGTASADDRISASKKGSLLIYSKVELKWEQCLGGYCLTQDTILDLSNDYPDYVSVQFYFVNGDGPLDEETGSGSTVTSTPSTARLYAGLKATSRPADHSFPGTS